MWGLVHSVCRIVNMIISNQIGKENKNNKKRTRKQERVRKHNSQGAWTRRQQEAEEDDPQNCAFETKSSSKFFLHKTWPKASVIQNAASSSSSVILSTQPNPQKNTYTQTHTVSILLIRKSPSSSVCFVRRKTKQGSSSQTKQTKEQQEEMGLSRAQTNPTPNKIPHSLQ